MRTFCPLCSSVKSREMHKLTLTYGEEQIIHHCLNCGMVYASADKMVDYDNDSIYSIPGACGSGESPYDRVKCDALADQINKFLILKSMRILDIGCARGGLLEALREIGFTDLWGMDPSKRCVDAVSQKGFKWIQGFIGDHIRTQFDFIVMSHVVEHLENPVRAVKDVCDLLKLHGRLYIEVPDADKYIQYNAPFMDFNAEHINHFNMRSLTNLVHMTDFRIVDSGHKEIAIPGSGQVLKYPAIWLLLSKTSIEPSTCHVAIEKYIEKSKEQLGRINEYLEDRLAQYDKVIVWGCNSYCANIIDLPVFKRVKIIQGLDNNVAHYKKKIRDFTIYTPDECIDNETPIVITSLMAIDSIRRNAWDLGMSNTIISIPVEVYS